MASFEAFLEGWNTRHENLLKELEAAMKRYNNVGQAEVVQVEEEMEELISRALVHYEEYYEQRSRAAHADVFQVFSPTWSSSPEFAFSWIAGFRPTAVFALLYTAVPDLSIHQSIELDRVKARIKVEERDLSDKQATVQESVAAPPFVDAATRAGRQTPHSTSTGTGTGSSTATGNGSSTATGTGTSTATGTVGGVGEEALHNLRVAMETLLEKADSLRMKTAALVVGILTTQQRIKFLAAATKLLRNMKIRGVEGDDPTTFRRYGG